jgi:predicted PP-loop superfamily ATPase
MYSICQRCDSEHSLSWTVQQAEFHVGGIDHWKVQLCARCTEVVEKAVLTALKSTKPAAPTPEPDA